MRFLSNGDFIFPFQAYPYIAQHIYMWSYQHGAPNPNGIIRMPGRLLDILVFAVFGNLGGAYFYVFSCLIVAFLAFWWFARVFLNANRQGTALLGALFFAVNPIFLGNLSKVGLILAAAMLPLALVALKKGFEQKRFSYFLLYILTLNISLLHPFTFSINILTSGCYLIHLVRTHRAFFWDNLHKFGLICLAAVLLNAYLLLPIASLGTVDKSALSDSATKDAVDYTSLVDIANTGDILTGLSLSKNILKDYDFYGARTWPFYFLGVFVFYALILITYISIERRVKPADRRGFVISLATFLVLLVLATVTYLHIDLFIKFLINLPGGWAFRAPLKWQLYMPLVLFTSLVIVLKNVRDTHRLRLSYVAFGLCFLLMNGYLFNQIYVRLLTPRSLTYLSELERASLDHKNLLFVDSVKCFDYAQATPSLATELNQIFVSKDLQVKHVQAGDIDTVNLSQYDYVMGCGGAVNETLLTKSYDFKSKAAFADGKYRLYENQHPLPYIAATTQVFRLKETREIGAKHALARSMGQTFNFVSSSESHLPTVAIQDLFEGLGPSNIINNRLQSSFTSSAGQQLLIEDGPPIFFTQKQQQLQFSTVEQKDMSPVSDSLELGDADRQYEVSYYDPLYSYTNLIPNPSLEAGNWQYSVGDCNAYDKKPALSMRLDQQSSTHGAQSLVLTAKAHIACTGPDKLPTKAGQHYLLSFDYRSGDERYAGYYVGFDDHKRSSTNARLPGTANKWRSFSTTIVAPLGATHLRLLVYAYPNKSLNTIGTASYDNFKLIPIPPAIGRFFVVNKEQLKPNPTPAIEFTKLDPTKTQITVKNAKESFYLITKESYHRLWELNSSGHKLGGHLRVNGTMNGWYINPEDVCSEVNCIKHDDGSFDFRLTMEFVPQRWFYIGCMISGITAILALLFVIYDLRRGRRVR
jgi:hypothetical protein